MAMTTENGIHMKYSGAVREQRLNAGKPVEAPPEPAPVPDMSDLTASRVENLKLVYGMMLCIGTARIKDIQERTGRSYNWAADALVELQARGLLSARQVGSGAKSPYEYMVVGDATLPEGWEVDALREMAGKYVPPVSGPKDDGTLIVPGRSERKECAMAVALARDAPIRAEDAPAYKELLDFLLGAPEGTGELKAIMKELRRFLQYRSSNVKTVCPFCSGQVINDKGTALCKGCKRRIDMGSFEESLSAMRTLAELERRGIR